MSSAECLPPAVGSADQGLLSSSGHLLAEEAGVKPCVCSNVKEGWLGLSFGEDPTWCHLKARSGLLKGMSRPYRWTTGPLARGLRSKMGVSAEL